MPLICELVPRLEVLIKCKRARLKGLTNDEKRERHRQQQREWYRRLRECAQDRKREELRRMKCVALEATKQELLRKIETISSADNKSFG
jgi:uncharacterized protein